MVSDIKDNGKYYFDFVKIFPLIKNEALKFGEKINRFHFFDLTNLSKIRLYNSKKEE